MGYLILFACLLGAAILLIRSAQTLPAAQLAKLLRYVGGGLLGLLCLFLAVTGRLGLAIPVGAFAFALLSGNTAFLGRLAKAVPGFGSPSEGQVSTIETPWLSLWLEHDSGHMGGRVRQGRFSGADLAHLDGDDLRLLREELGHDAESLRLLDGYIERERPDVDETGASEESEEQAGDWGKQSRRQSSGIMSEDEAYEVLGLSPGATVDEIKAAHRELMRKVHPDTGGSSYLAAKINQAKDLLLSRARA
ncbi:DnaJ domain-containing protein [Pyruvatibacter mobilis]|jgi:hypothetical protein|uniref:DnaJ domain-containing protein n=1 Tax=Pyruvatibacter mobilis TaxID=1712261 RepID=UPI003BA991B1